jgi:nucleoside-diphosphate-sugar epimerase
VEGLANKKILITGATGFVGSNLLRYLIAMGNKQLFIISRKSSNPWRIRDLLGQFTPYYVDLTDKEPLQRVVSELKPDVIFHNAQYGAYRHQTDEDEILQTNYLGTVNLLRSLSREGFQAFVNVGSYFEYGRINGPFSEGSLPNPLDAYGVSKLAATYYSRMIAISRDLPIITLRLFHVYGYYEEYYRLIPYLIISMLRREDARIHNPKGMADFIFIDDVVSAMVRAAELADQLPRGEIINVGTGSSHTNIDVFNALKKIIDYKSEPTIGGQLLPRDYILVQQADVSKAKALLKWEAQYDLFSGLTKDVEWFKGHLDLYEREKTDA